VILFQRRVAPVLAGWILLLLAVSIATAIDLRTGGDLYLRLALVPARIGRGELWRLVTWSFVELDPKALVFTCVTIFWFGGELLAGWGARRFVRVFAAIGVATAIATSLLAIVLGATYHAWIGGWALGDALVIAWGLTYPERSVRVYSVLVLDGETLAHFTFAFTILCALFYGVVAMLPMLLAGAAAFAYGGGSLPRWLRKKRKLRSVRGGKQPHGPYWN
jgi:hypothetical protein